MSGLCVCVSVCVSLCVSVFVCIVSWRPCNTHSQCICAYVSHSQLVSHSVSFTPVACHLFALSPVSPVASADFRFVCPTKIKNNFYFPKATIKLLPEAFFIFVAVVVVVAFAVVIVIIMPTQICKMFCAKFSSVYITTSLWQERGNR